MSENLTEIECLSRDVALLSAFVHGDEAATVPLGGTDTPTLRALVADIRAGVTSLTAKLQNYETRLARLESLLEGFGEVVTDGHAAYIFQPVGAPVKVAVEDVPDATNL